MTVSIGPSIGLVADAIPVKNIRDSAYTVRQIFSETEITQLADSIQQDGLISPLVVRRSGDVYEIVAGRRRLRAVKKLGWDKVPVFVRDLTDVQAAQIQIVENLHREGITELEEAQSYQDLMKLSSLTVPDIAKQIKKPVSHVYARLKLLDLSAGGKKYLAAGTLTAGHAILLARLEPKLQDHLLKGCDEDTSVRELQRMIYQEIYQSLSGVAWPLKDATVVKAAGPCSMCPKNTDVSKDLFKDVKPHTCTDPTCYDAKSNAWLASVLKHLTKNKVKYTPISDQLYPRDKKLTGRQVYDVTAKSKPGSVLGLMMDGRDRGKQFHIMLRKDRHTDVFPRRKVKKDPTEKIYHLALEQLHKRKIKALQRRDLELCALRMIDNGAANAILALYGLNRYGNSQRKVSLMSAQELNRFLVEVASYPRYIMPGTKERLFEDTLKRHHISVDTIRKSLQTSAKKKGAKDGPTAKR